MRPVLTFGVDLASQAKRTAGCLLEWRDHPVLIDLVSPLSDDRIVEIAVQSDVARTAIDAPFGWPRSFVEAVATYGRSEGFPETGGDLWLRRTDHVVWRQTGRRPLSVSADRIEETANRPPHFLARVAVTPEGLKQMGDRQIVPGMAAEVVVKTGERTLLAYILKPMVRRVAASLKEH